jgi:hypothetical protein
MRQTVKYKMAVAQLRLLVPIKASKVITKSVPHEDLYSQLESAGYWWDSKAAQWKKAEENDRAKGRFSGSIFEYPDGLPSGVYRLRVMAHPNEMDAVCQEVTQRLNVIEVSKPYDNRKGAGQRVYILCKRRPARVSTRQ